MTSERNMVKVTRRSFLLSAAALSAGCASNRHGAAGPRTPASSVRQPAVGQSWRYAKHDFYSRKLVDYQIDRIAAVGSTVDIDSQSEAAKTDRSSWGSSWLSKYVPHRDAPDGALPSEIQQPWSKVLVDPHWSQVQVYETPIPLWPTQLQPGWKYHIDTKYKAPSNQDGLPWDQTMTAHAWETITVPAGTFKALRYSNLINFRSVDFSRADSRRMESIWFAPEVGRWVVRESSGSYYMDDSSVDTPYNEPGYRWELLEWT
jgi:hypothetical protein